MDYCSGGDLNMYIKARGKIETLEYVPEPGAAPIYFPHPKSGGLDQRVVRSLLLQLANSLKFLRDRNLMHRDLKPQVKLISNMRLGVVADHGLQNLLLQPASPDDISRGHLLGAPILKVADFGFARILPSAAMADTLCGSPYVAHVPPWLRVPNSSSRSVHYFMNLQVIYGSRDSLLRKIRRQSRFMVSRRRRLRNVGRETSVSSQQSHRTPQQDQPCQLPCLLS